MKSQLLEKKVDIYHLYLIKQKKKKKKKILCVPYFKIISLASCKDSQDIRPTAGQKRFEGLVHRADENHQ